MNYWKLGCNWGSGNPCFYEMLKKHSIVICGPEDMQEGDYVAVCKGHNVVAIAKIIKNYISVTSNLKYKNDFSEKNIDYEDRIKVFDSVIYELPSNEQFAYQLQQGICKIHQLDIKNKINKFVNIINIMHKNMSDKKYVANYIELLKANHNLILTGAPGTGKTYLAKQIAKQMDAEVQLVQFHPSYDYTDFVEGLRPISTDVNGNIGFGRMDGVFKEFCKKAIFKNDFDELEKAIEQFKTDCLENDDLFLNTKNNIKFSVTYRNGITFRVRSIRSETPIGTDFPASIENIRKVYSGIDKGVYNKSYVRGILDHLIKEYHVPKYISSNKRKDYVFIIDEINRGEISKILGELFYSIDPGYRGDEKGILTQYHNLIEEGDVFKEGFYIPANVYVIGTMNDIDRSVESMDFAMRRRFAWKEVMSGERLEMWDGKIDQWKYEAKLRMEALNGAIENIEGLSSAYHIGASYFLKLSAYNGDFEKLWNLHLNGVLKEYLRGAYNADEKLDLIKLAYNNPIKK